MRDMRDARARAAAIPLAERARHERQRARARHKAAEATEPRSRCHAHEPREQSCMQCVVTRAACANSSPPSDRPANKASPTGCSEGASPTGCQPTKANEKPKQTIHSHTTAIHSHARPFTATRSHARPFTATHSRASEHAATAACTSDATRPPLSVAPTGATKRGPPLAHAPRACECYPPPPPTGNGGGGSPPPQPTKRAGAPCHHLTEGGGGPRSQAQTRTHGATGEPLRKGRVRKYPAAPLRTAPPVRSWRAWKADRAS